MIPPTGVYVHELFVVSLAGWMVLYDYCWDGDTYGLAYELGEPTMTEQQARDSARQLRTAVKAQLSFLHLLRKRDINDIELKETA